MDLSLILTLVLLSLCLLGLSWFAGSDAPYLPTKKNIIPVLKAAGCKKGKVFYELGSGDGRIVIEAAKLGVVSFGIEQSLLRIWYSKYKAWKGNIKNVKFLHGNIFKFDLSVADIVYIYLLPKGVDKLEAKLRKELKKNTVLITQTYHFKNIKPYKKLSEFWLYKM